jgi:ribosomal protein S18 acetylase RimI-like enzyme
MQTPLETRPATISDRQELEKFLNFEFFVHQHLDWFSPTDWLENYPFILALHKNEIIACIAAINEVQDIAWLRLFACSSFYSRDQVWNLLFPKLVSQLKRKVRTLAVLGVHEWLVKLLKNKSFTVHQEIIVLERSDAEIPEFNQTLNLKIKPIQNSQIKQIAQLDSRSFKPIWQLPEISMRKAYSQSGYATVAFLDDKLVGYQMTTENPSSAHLARLAVDPIYQGRNIGKSLIKDLIEHYNHKGMNNISVNTQNDNFASKALYTNTGFKQNTERYPVLIYNL